MTTSADPKKFAGNISQIANKTIPTGAEVTQFTMLDPNKRNNILVASGGETVEVSFAIDVKTPAAGRLTEDTINDSSVLFTVVHNSTDDYFAGDTRGVSIMRVKSDPVTTAVQYSATEVTE